MSEQVEIAEPLVTGVHRFGPITFQGDEWDLSHLDAYAFRHAFEDGSQTTVLVLFSCHCFTHSFKRDPRPRAAIPADEIYDDNREVRVLCPARYEASRRLLRDLVATLQDRHIVMADERQPNFVTVESSTANGQPALYGVFFVVERDTVRKNRLILRIQSAYFLDKPVSKRQQGVKRVKLSTILKRVFEGVRIRP